MQPIDESGGSQTPPPGMGEDDDGLLTPRNRASVRFDDQRSALKPRQPQWVPPAVFPTDANLSTSLSGSIDMAVQDRKDSKDASDSELPVCASFQHVLPPLLIAPFIITLAHLGDLVVFEAKDILLVDGLECTTFSFSFSFFFFFSFLFSCFLFLVSCFFSSF